jgi:hypothetical protein
MVFYETLNCSICLFKATPPSLDKCVIVFSQLGRRSLNSLADGADYFNRLGYDIVSIQSIADDWHQCIPREELTKLHLYLSKNYSEIYSYGTSMGGYSAIATSAILKPQCVIALSPQYEINGDYDTRWKRYYEHINWICSINECRHYSGSVYLLYDPKDKDRIHAEKISNALSADQITHIKVKFSSHPITNSFMMQEYLKILQKQYPKENRQK